MKNGYTWAMAIPLGVFAALCSVTAYQLWGEIPLNLFAFITCLLLASLSWGGCIGIFLVTRFPEDTK